MDNWHTLSQWAPRIFLSLPSQCCDYKHLAPIFLHMISGEQTQILYRLSRLPSPYILLCVCTKFPIKMWAFPKYFPSIKYCTWRTLVTWQTLVTCCLSLSGGEGPLLGFLYHGGAGRHLSPKVCGELVLTNNRTRNSLAKLCVCGHSRPPETVSQQFIHFLFCNL